MDRFSPNQVPAYHVEHLATFSTTSDQHEHITPRMALQRLFTMEKTSGIWTQRMDIQLKGNQMWILDGETNDVVERFPVAFIHQPTSFNDQNHIYNNILIFIVQLPNERQGELHIFQCDSHDAVNVVDDIYHWMRHYGVVVANNNNNNNNNSGAANSTNHHHNNQHHHRTLSPNDTNHHHSLQEHHSRHHHLHNNSVSGNGNEKPGPSGAGNNGNGKNSHPSSNVNVKEAVNAFNQIAAQREKKGASTDSIHRIPTIINSSQASPTAGNVTGVDLDSRSDSSSFAEPLSTAAGGTTLPSNTATTVTSSASNHHHHHHHHNNHSHHPNQTASANNSNLKNHHHHHNSNNGSHHNRNHEMNEQNYTNNERYVSILNHCFDDIERFIIRLQHAAAALRELQIRSHKRGAKGSGDGLLAIRARGPCEEEFFEILSKFKLAFNLLAKLKGCIHDPNAPELVHFLFTPLAIIIEAAQSNEPPVDPSMVGIPYLSADAVELLSNCCTSKEYDLWQSLGANWIQPHLRMSSPFQPVFTDGWAPAITEPELLGLITLTDMEPDPNDVLLQTGRITNNNNKSRIGTFDDSDYDEHNGDHSKIIHHSMSNARTTPTNPNQRLIMNQSPSPIESIDRDSPSAVGNAEMDGEQLDWLVELQNRNAKIVRVLFPRTANNSKELTVTRGEILEVLDDSRKWWKARNYRGQVAHVPHTIVGEIESSHLMSGSGITASNSHQHHNHPSTSMMTNDDWVRRERQVETTPIAPRRMNLALLAELDQTVNNFAIRRPKLMSIDNSNAEVMLPTKHLASQSVPTVVSADSEKLPDNFDNITEEINALIKSGKGFSKTVSLIRQKDTENFMKQFEKTEDKFTSKDLVLYLSVKEFTPELMQFVETLFDIKEIRCKLLDWSKDELRNNIPPNIADDFIIKRLHSNLLLLRKMVKSSKFSTLDLKLKQRQRILLDNYKKSKASKLVENVQEEIEN